MPIYEYQGQHYDIDTTDSAEAKRKILMSQQPEETATQTFGRSAASLADSALNTVTGTLDMAAYPFARAYYGTVGGLPADQAAARATQETTSPKDVFGRMAGVTGTRGYENAPVRQAGNYIGQGLQENVIQPLAQTTGLPETDIGNMVGIGTVAAGPMVPKVAGAVGRGTANTVRGAVDVGAGAIGGFTGDVARPGARPKPGQTASARQPIGETYIPQEELARWRAGEVETANLQSRPTAELPQKALARTGGTVPFEGQGLRAFGEQLGQDYRNPYKLGAEVAGDYLLGGVPTVARLGMKAYQGIQGARAASELSRYGFTPLTAAEQAALKSGKPYPNAPAQAAQDLARSKITPPTTPAQAMAQEVTGPVVPQLSYNPTPPPPVMNMPGPGRRVNIEGESYNLPYQIDLSQVQTARPQQAAALAPVAPVAPVAPAPRAPSLSQTLDVTKRDAIVKLLADMQAKKDAEIAAATAPKVAGPIAPDNIRPWESAADIAAITAEDRALAQKTPRESIDQTLKAAITQQGKIDKTLLNETVASLGLDPIDWSKLGIGWQSMSIKDARKTVAKYIGEQTGLRGPGSRGERATTQMARANKALDAEDALKTPEQLAQETADIERRLRAMGNKYRPPSRGE